ncbi:S1 family peptidase [Rhodococcus sp. ACT016]|uniref:S1 family peptidase n=1 Tax=Rhodococcus sp. ACT016 TaxID=3134808 RepID=UPI003D27E9F9
MRIRLARCAAIIGTSVALAALSATGVVQAQPAPSPADRLPADLVAAIERDLHLTPEEYLARADAAQQVAGYASDMRRVDPGGFGGAWLGDDGTPIVAVGSPAAAARVAAAGYRAEVVSTPLDGMEGALAQQKRLSDAPPTTPQFHVASGTDPIGGDAYIAATGPLATAQPLLVCSFGFTAADRAGTPLVLSAGHCDPSRATTGTANAASVYAPTPTSIRTSPRVGDFGASGIGPSGGGLDYSVIRLTPEAAAAGLGRPEVRGGPTGVLTVTGTAVPVVGAPVCKSGQTSGYTCGKVLDSDFTTDLFGDGGESWSVRGFTDSACTLAGDSGGAIVTGTLALGITSGSNVADAADCARAAAAPGGTMSFGIPVRAILSHVNGSSCPAGPGVGLRTASHPAGLCETPESMVGGTSPLGSLGSTGS